MNVLAIVVGLVFGVLSAAMCYGVSMITSGLFARPFYRLYSRVLIGICCVMLLAPALRWLAASSPMMGAIGLSIAQYLAVAVLGYGVYRFNRDYMQRVFLQRKTTAYFVFGTLAYATVVTLAFLHVAVGGTPSWAGHGHGYITAGHYGPLLVLLAVMVFDTDTCLKSIGGDTRRFSRFTFVGYAISFLGVSVSTVPFVAEAFHRLSSVAVDSPWIQSLSSAEALLIAICLYGWLVWRYESIPPLFLLLLAIIAEYHVLVTQWLLRAYGPECWGLASLPLFAGIALLDHYFGNWDERKQHARERHWIADDETVNALRFATPLRIVQWGLAAVLFGVTGWTRFYPGDISPSWLGVTFAIYSGFFLLMSFARQQPSLIYLAGGLAGLAASFGLAPPAGPVSTVVLAGVGVVAGVLACLGERRGLKLSWRTPLTDISMLSAVLVIGLVFSRHIIGSDPYRFHAVGLLDGLALAGSMLACVACGLQYRSQLPVFGVLLAAVTMIPMWSAGLGLLAMITATLIDRWIPKDRSLLVDDRVRLFGRFSLAFPDVLPGLLSRPLSLGGIPLALLGLTISVLHVVQGDFSTTALVGAAIAALALLLLTRNYREPWLYITSILASYFAIHAIAQGRWFVGWPAGATYAGHLTITSTISLVGWLAASGYAWWCTTLLRRCAEDKEPSVRLNRSYYSGWLFHVTAIIALIPLAANWLVWLRTDLPIWSMCSASLVAILFALAASVYRSRIGSYLSLTALTLAVFSGFEWLDLPSLQHSTILAGLSFLAAMASCLSHEKLPSEASSDQPSTSWLPAVPALTAKGLGLWLQPLALYALVCSPIAAFSVMHSESTWSLAHIWSRPAPLTYALASITLLLSTRAFRVSAIYVVSIAFAYAAFHSAAQWAVTAGWFETDANSIQLLVGAILSLTSCLIAISLTSWINRRIPLAENERQFGLRTNREFYAGILHHFALLVAAFSLATVAGMAVFDAGYFAAFAPIHALTAVVLTAGFSISGIIYLSRLHTYAALASIIVAVLAGVAIWASPPDLLSGQAVSAAIVAIAFGIGSWLLISPSRAESVSDGDDQSKGMSWRFNECWEHPPLPLVSRDRTLWAKPLAHASTVVALAAIVPMAMLWGRSPAWITLLPMYLASGTWLIATFTYGAGMLGGLDRLSNPSVKTSSGSKSDAIERGLLYAASILAFGRERSRNGAVEQLAAAARPRGHCLAPGHCRRLVVDRMGCGDGDRRAIARYDRGGN